MEELQAYTQDEGAEVCWSHCPSGATPQALSHHWIVLMTTARLMDQVWALQVLFAFNRAWTRKVQHTYDRLEGSHFL